MGTAWRDRGGAWKRAVIDTVRHHRHIGIAINVAHRVGQPAGDGDLAQGQEIAAGGEVPLLGQVNFVMLHEVDFAPFRGRQPHDDKGQLPEGRDDDIRVGHIGGSDRAGVIDKMQPRRHAIVMRGRCCGLPPASRDQPPGLDPQTGCRAAGGDDRHVMPHCLKPVCIDRDDTATTGQVGRRADEGDAHLVPGIVTLRPDRPAWGCSRCYIPAAILRKVSFWATSSS